MRQRHPPMVLQWRPRFQHEPLSVRSDFQPVFRAVFNSSACRNFPSHFSHTTDYRKWGILTLENLNGEMINYRHMFDCTPLTITDIAAWQLEVIQTTRTWFATLPSLQRGAVWKAGQVELFWDSLFRGFPVGALIVSQKLESQSSRSGKVAGRKSPRQDKGLQERHLLDGQQRCDAIARGFVDPFSMPDGETLPDILWIDLCPGDRLPKSSTREFLFRLTTKAHPWGYVAEDPAPGNQAGKLRAFEMCNAMTAAGWKAPEGSAYQRPLPAHLCPWRASCPVPLAWLMAEAAVERPLRELRGALLGRCRCKTVKSLPWAKMAASTLKDAACEAALDQLSAAVRRALTVQIPFVEVSPEVIKLPSRLEVPSRPEEQAGSGADQNITNIEHLFQRLNNGGTQINSEDLKYSTIKAYWPGMEESIERIKPQPMPPSRMALLGARAALAVRKDFPPDLSVKQLREIAAMPGMNPLPGGERELVRQFFEISENGRDLEPAPDSMVTLRAVMKTVDGWLRYLPGVGDYGLHASLRTAIARESPEVFLLLMIIAARVMTQGGEVGSLRRCVVGLATSLHWFTQDKGRSVRHVYERLVESGLLNVSFFRGILHGFLPRDSLPVVAAAIPEKLTEWLEAPSDDCLLTPHDWEKAVILDLSSGDEIKRREMETSAWPLVCRVVWNYGLLQFAQRRWMAEKFAAYDAAELEIWDEHNCPWDFDHLWPRADFTNVRGTKFLKVCQRWGDSIGNLHILPFEENRKRGAKPANHTFPSDRWASMLIHSSSELDAFSCKSGAVLNDRTAVLCFIKAARRRILDIYKDWHDTLEIGYLTGTHEGGAS